jgi:hypothetical protein
LSRAGFGATPAWSKIIASASSIFRTVSRFRVSLSFAMSSATSVGVMVSIGRAPMIGTMADTAARWFPLV